MSLSEQEKSEIVFFDLETTAPTRPGQGFAILEFGAILVCPKKLVELRHFSTLVRPADLSQISSLSARSNGITKDAVIYAPNFATIADAVYDLLNERIWAGHNILRFDCARLREAFAEINRPPPEPKGTIDSLALLTRKFGKRAGDMKMASLAKYFGIGQQTHRSLDDVRMNLEVLKYCATVLFLESSLPDIFTEGSWISPNAITRSRSNKKSSTEKNYKDTSKSSPLKCTIMEENPPITSLVSPNTCDEVSSLLDSKPDTFDLAALLNEIEKDPLADDSTGEKTSSCTASEEPLTILEDSSSCIEFFDPDNVSTVSISVTLVPFYRGYKKIQVLHMKSPLQLCCKKLQIRFGISRKFTDHFGRPRLNFVVDAPSKLCEVLAFIDDLAEKTMTSDLDSFSEWRPAVTRKPGFYNSPTIRLHLPIVADGDDTRLVTELYQKDASATHKLEFSTLDMTELELLLTPGNLVDAYFSLDTYDYQQKAGIRLVAKKLIL